MLDHHYRLEGFRTKRGAFGAYLNDFPYLSGSMALAINGVASQLSRQITVQPYSLQ